MVGNVDSLIGPIAATLNVGGIFVFALSGALAAARRGLDVFGIVVVAYIPALGGGTLRDMLLARPANWIETPMVLILPLVAALIAILGNSVLLGRRLTALVWADALGMAAFAALGAQLGFEITSSVPLAIILGLCPAIAGGIVRDIVLNEVPLVLHAEVYAIAAALGGATTSGLLHFGFSSSSALACGFAAGFLLRAMGIRFNLQLPKLTQKQDH